MKNELTHTPTPWEQKSVHIWAPASQAMIATVCEPYPKEAGIGYAELRIDSENINEAWANAALIVRAVNSHAALVDALSRMVDVVGHNACTDGQTPNGFVVALERARAALKLAEEKE